MKNNVLTTLLIVLGAFFVLPKILNTNKTTTPSTPVTPTGSHSSDTWWQQLVVGLSGQDWGEIFG